MEEQIRQLPPHVLAPEVAAAARDILAQRPLTEVGREAIRIARGQLAVERNAIGGTSEARVTALAQSGGSSLQLAALAVEQSAVTPQADSYEERIDFATGRLQEIDRDLERLEAGDPAAAGRMSKLFSAIVDRVLAPAAVVA